MNTVMRSNKNIESAQINGAKECEAVDRLVWVCEAIFASRMPSAKARTQRDRWDQKMPFLTFRITDTDGSTKWPEIVANSCNNANAVKRSVEWWKSFEIASGNGSWLDPLIRFSLR